MDPEETFEASYVIIDPTVEELSLENVTVTSVAGACSNGSPSASVAVWARCIGYIGFGTSLLSLGLLLLVPSFVLAANQAAPEPSSPRPRRQRRYTVDWTEHRRSPSLSSGHSKRSATLPHPSHHKTRSCLEKIPIPPGRRVTFREDDLPRSIAAALQPSVDLSDEIQVYKLCDDDCSTTSSATSSTTSSSIPSPSMAIFGASSIPTHGSPTSTEHPLLAIPESVYLLEADVSAKPRRTLAERIPRVAKLFSGWRRQDINSPPLSPSGSDDVVWSPKRPKPLILLSYRRKAFGKTTGTPSGSVESSPATSPVADFSPLPSPATSVESKQSYFRRRSSDRRNTPVSRTEPYGAPYFAAAPIVSPPRAPVRRRSRSLTRRSEDIRLACGSERRVGRPPVGRVITKRRSASADCIITKNLQV